MYRGQQNVFLGIGVNILYFSIENGGGIYGIFLRFCDFIEVLRYRKVYFRCFSKQKIVGKCFFCFSVLLNL